MNGFFLVIRIYSLLNKFHRRIPTVFCYLNVRAKDRGYPTMNKFQLSGTKNSITPILCFNAVNTGGGWFERCLNEYALNLIFFT